MLKRSKKSSEQGFTLAEVLIAILLSTIFITMALQLLMTKTSTEVSNKNKSQSSTWIEQDQVKIMGLADSMASSYGFCINPDKSYAVKLWRVLENETTITLPGKNEANGIILEDTGSNYAHPDFPMQKRLSPATNKLYKLKRNYTIKTEAPDILVINYAIIDPDTNEKIIENEVKIKTNDDYECR